MSVGAQPEPLSIRSLARQVGRAEGTVRKWIKRRDWPFGRGPFVVDDVRRWMEMHLGRDPAQRYHDAQRGIGDKPLSQLERARTLSYFEAAQIRRLKRQQLEGKLHDADECRARRRRQVLRVRNALTRSLPRTLAGELVGRARGDMERLLRDRLAAVCEAFADEHDE